MSEFRLSDGIDEDKIFLVDYSNLQERYDPLYYSKVMLGFFEKIKYKTYYFNQIILNIKSGIGAGKQDQSDSINGILHLRPTNINKDSLLKFDKNIYIPNNSKIPKVQKNDILFNNTNSQELVGKTVIVDNNLNASFSNHITRIRVNNEIIKPRFLWIILNFYQKKKIFYNICTNWNNQSGVGLELLKKLIIPIPPKQIQQNIIDIMDKAYLSKKQKELQAKELLESIDTYLLDELGITLPEVDNSLEKRIFEIQLSDVSGGRFDPLRYYSIYLDKVKSIFNSSFEIKLLSDFVLSSISGDWGDDEKKIKNFSEYKKCLVIRATEFDNKFNIKIDSSRKKYRFIKKEKLSKLNIEENDILIEKSGGSPSQPVGRVVILTKDIIENNLLGYSNFIHKIKLKNTINSLYVFNYLRAIYNKKITENMQSQTNGIRNLIMNEFLNIPIPLPPIEKQNEIAKHIQTIRDKAKQLKLEAVQELEKAKAEVEQMILGDG